MTQVNDTDAMDTEEPENYCSWCGGLGETRWGTPCSHCGGSGESRDSYEDDNWDDVIFCPVCLQDFCDDEKVCQASAPKV